jgi:hypothetical protein
MTVVDAAAGAVVVVDPDVRVVLLMDVDVACGMLGGRCFLQINSGMPYIPPMRARNCGSGKPCDLHSRRGGCGSGSGRANYRVPTGAEDREDGGDEVFGEGSGFSLRHKGNTKGNT